MEKETTYSLGYLLDRTLWALSNSLNIAFKVEVLTCRIHSTLF